MNKLFNSVLVLVGEVVVLGLISPVSAGSAGEKIRDLERLILSQQAQIKDLHVANQAIIVELNDLKYHSTQQVIPPKMTSSGSDKVKLKVYGQVNRAFLWYDDGSTSDLRHVDNDASSTRIGFEGNATATDDLKEGGKAEVQFESNSSGDIGQADNTAGGTGSFTQRKLELYLTSKSWGKFSIGQGSTASDGASERNLSGVSLATGGSAPSAMGGALQFATPGTGALSGKEIDDVYSNQDGLSRDDRLRWDSPNINGFTFSISAVDGGRPTWV